MTTLYKYRIYCDTDAKWEYVWLETETPPTICPTNSAHTVNPDSVTEIDIKEPNTTIIDDEKTPLGYPKTGKNYRLITRAFDAPANQTVSFDIAFKYPICIHAGQLVTEANQKGDRISIEGGRGTTCGVLTAAVALNDTAVPVSPTVVCNLKIGRHVSLTDGVNTTPYIAVVDINTNTNVITLDTGTPYAFAAGTLVKFTIFVVHDVEIGPPGEYRIGNRTMGATYIPANMVQTVTYVNTTGDAKRISCIIETTY